MDLALPVAAELATICVNLNEQIDRHEQLTCCRGGCATVYKGTLRVDGIKVAIKTERSLLDGFAMKHILCEARVWSKLRHENIVPLLGFTTIFDASVSLISPWQERGNAHNYVQDRAVDPRPLLLGVARGLDYLHSHASGPIVHGDLKGQNILISGDGRALITDFGFSFLAEPSVSITRSGGGTLKWMAPEILDNGPASIHSDMWAFGMTTLELFTGQEPFHGISTGATIISIVKGLPGRPAAKLTCDRLTDAWWSICMRCWKQDPASRPSAPDILANIERVGCLVNKPRSTQFEPANSIQLAPAAQPFLEVAGARHFGMVFRHGPPVDFIYNRRFFVAFIAIIAVHMLAVWFGLSEGTLNLTTLSRIRIP